MNITDASKKRIARLASMQEPPAAWRASTLRTIAEWLGDFSLQLRPPPENWLGTNGGTRVVQREGELEKQFGDWAEFLRQEADRLEEAK